MYCRNCGKETPLHSAFCLHCGSKIAIQQAVPLQAKAAPSPTKAGGNTPKILALSALGLICFAALIYGLSGDTSQRRPEASLTVSGQRQQAAGNDAAVMVSVSPARIDVATPVAGRSVKDQGKSRAAARSALTAASAQLNSAATPATAPAVETVPAPTIETGPVRTLAPKPKQVEATFYITRTGKRYHRGGCRHLRHSAYPITRAEAEAQGYTPCRVCYP
jgi:zinc ribbon protein